MNNQENTDISHILPVIMAGGEGSRLRPVTDTMPKPMIDVDGIPAIVRILQLLSDAGFDRAVITVRYLAACITDALGAETAGIAIQYLTEDVPLGTAGSVRAAWNAYAKEDDTDVLVISGDAVCSLDVAAFLEKHRREHAAATLLTAYVSEPSAFGTILTNEAGAISAFVEKPSAHETVTDRVNTGIYLLSGALIETVPTEGTVDFGSDVFPAALQRGDMLFAHPTDGYWCDIGTHDAYLRCVLDMAMGKLAAYSPLLAPQRTGLPPYISESSVGRECFIPSTASVRSSVLFDGVKIGAGASVTGAILCKNTEIGADAVISARCVIGEGAVIGDGVFLQSGTKVPAGTHVEQSGTGADGGSAAWAPSASVPPDFLSQYTHDSGYYVSAAAQPHVPDVRFCVALGRALAKDQEKHGGTLFFAVTKEDPALFSACALIKESTVCAAADSGLQLTFCNGLAAFSAARYFDCGENSLSAVRRILFTHTDGRLSAIFCGTYGAYLSRSEERALDAILADMLDTGTRPDAVPQGGQVLHPPRMIAAEAVTGQYLQQRIVPLQTPAGAHFAFRTGNTPQEKLLARLLKASGAVESMDAKLFFHLFPNENAECADGTLQAVDLTVPSRVYSHWELFSMWLVGQPIPQPPLLLPFGIPDYVEQTAAAHGTAIRFFTHCGARLKEPPCAEAQDGILLALRMAELLSVQQTSLAALYRAAFGDGVKPHVRMFRSCPAASSAAAMRRMTEGAPHDAFQADREGVLYAVSDAGEHGTVRVVASRTPNLRIIADAYSQEAAEALCDMAIQRAMSSMGHMHPLAP